MMGGDGGKQFWREACRAGKNKNMDSRKGSKWLAKVRGGGKSLDFWQKWDEGSLKDYKNPLKHRAN